MRDLAAAGAKAIGLDFIGDRTTTPAADAALMNALHHTKDVPIVLGAIDHRTKFIWPRCGRDGRSIRSVCHRSATFRLNPQHYVSVQCGAD